MKLPQMLITFAWPLLSIAFASKTAGIDFDHLRRSVVRIQSVTPSFDWFHPFMPGQDSVSLGTGFIVQTEPYLLFATNQHVINDASKVSLQLLLYGEKQWDAEVVSVCPRFDLSLLVLKDHEGFKKAMAEMKIEPKALQLSDEVGFMGQDVVAMGFPLGQNSLKISKGNVAGNEIVNDNICIQSTAPISPGNSGGPLLDDKAEKVVGVNFAKSTTGENINYVIPAWRVKQLIRKHLKDQPAVPESGLWQRMALRVPRHDLTTVESNDALYDITGCSAGMYVAKVGHRSFLRNAKPEVKPGSMLVSVKGKDVDHFGKGLYPEFVADKVSFGDIFFMVPDLSGEVDFHTCYKGETVKHKVSLAWSDSYESGIRYVDEPGKSNLSQAYESFGDLAVMEMTVNHILAVFKKNPDPSLARLLHPDYVTEPKLLVNYVRSGTYMSDILSQGAVVTKVNGKETRTLEDFRRNLVPEEGSKVWTLETDLGTIAAVRFKETMQEHLKSTEHSKLTPGVAAAAQRLGFLAPKEEAAPEKASQDQEMPETAIQAAAEAKETSPKNFRKLKPFGQEVNRHQTLLLSQSRQLRTQPVPVAAGPLEVFQSPSRAGLVTDLGMAHA